MGIAADADALAPDPRSASYGRVFAVMIRRNLEPNVIGAAVIGSCHRSDL
jgi:hypothetical protein